MPPKHSEDFKETARQRAFRRWEKWHKDNPDHAAVKKANRKAASERHAVKRFGSLTAKRYFYVFGEPIENKRARIEAQGGKCANRACGVPIDLTSGHQDHDHNTKDLRGVLCQKCNQALGMLQDSAEVVDGLSEYRKMFLPAPSKSGTM